jgi:type II secretory pathway pseudopilin PulG
LERFLMHPRTATFGFTLVEVILAIGIFAVAVIGVLGLLPVLGRQGASSTEALAVQRLPDAIRVELARLAQQDFDALAAQVPVMSSTPAPGLALVAARDAVRLHSRDYLRPAVTLPVDDQYFLIECWRFVEEPLSFAPQKAFLALEVRVTWPYRLPGLPDATDESGRSAATVAVSLRR